MRKVVVVNDPLKWLINSEGVEVVSAVKYLTEDDFSSSSKTKVFNLCNSYAYQSYGYYVSLLADARGHKPLPSVKTIQDMKHRGIIKVLSDEYDNLIQKLLGSLISDKFILSIYFGKNLAKKYDRLAYALYRAFESPMLRAYFVKIGNKWILQNIEPIPSSKIPEEHMDFVMQAAGEYFTLEKRVSVPKKKNYLYDLAILVNPDEKTAPSNDKAISKFMNAARSLGINPELITKEDGGRLTHFDALFIRETTSVNHHTYSFARKAEAEGLQVIDEPMSIMRCTNKVYLDELLSSKKIPVPQTRIIHKGNLKELPWGLDMPVILKLPDSSFSQGVVKAETVEECRKLASGLLEKSALIIAQEFMLTDFDWRVGVINGQPLYVCKYYMAQKHWQIVKTTGKGKLIPGASETMLVQQAPKEVVNLALKACSLIGKSLYGVDIKQSGGKCYVIEINDNPSIDAGVEDLVLKDELYYKVMSVFRERLDRSMLWRG